METSRNSGIAHGIVREDCEHPFPEIKGFVLFSSEEFYKKNEIMVCSSKKPWLKGRIPVSHLIKVNLQQKPALNF